MSESPSIVITATDLERLENLIASRRRTGETAALAAELERATVVDDREIGRGIVTMNSVVCFEDENTGERQMITLVYPHQADVERRQISVLAPVGAALLGLSKGQAITWPVPSGRPRRFRLLDVLSQPETESAAAEVVPS